jgi:hypothetical protein
VDDHLKSQIDAAGLALAEAFHDWKAKAEKPEQDLNLQEVSDAWDLLTFRDEQYGELTDPIRKIQPDWKPCRDCP